MHAYSKKKARGSSVTNLSAIMHYSWQFHKSLEIMIIISEMTMALK